jgi:hypothetical protein
LLFTYDPKAALEFTTPISGLNSFNYELASFLNKPGTL